MYQKTYDYIAKNIHRWSIDVENGNILNREVINTTESDEKIDVKVFTDKREDKRIRVKNVIAFLKFGHDAVGTMVTHKDGDGLDTSYDNIELGRRTRSKTNEVEQEDPEDDNPITKITSELIEIEEKMRKYEEKIKKLQNENSELLAQVDQLSKKNHELREELDGEDANSIMKKLSKILKTQENEEE